MTVRRKKKTPPQKLVKFKFSSTEDSAPPYAGLYPSLAPFQVDLQTHAIPKTKTKWRREDKEVSLKQLSGNSYWRMGIMTLLLHLWIFHLQRSL
jgi:hypothetical protein